MSRLLVKDDNGNIAPNGRKIIDSTTTPLGISATYTGAWIPVDIYGSLRAVILADESGDAYIEYSLDGTTKFTEDAGAITASALMRIDSSHKMLYARLKIINGTTAQSSLEAYFIATNEDSNINLNGKQVIDSTITPLGISATYTGAWFPVDIYGSLQIILLANQAGNAYIEYSMNSSTELAEDTAAIVADTLLKIDSTYEMLYARMKIINSTTAQTSLEAYLIAKA